MKKMQWFNEPDKWEIINDTSLSMYVTPNTDFWRKTHYGFTVDDGPFYYTIIGGEFELKVKITGVYKSRFDQMGAMIRIDEKTWIKAGIEYVNKKINLSAVVTHKYSDWSIVELQQKPDFVWLKIIRRLDAIEIKYSLDNEDYTLMRLAYFPDNTPTMVGLTAASPDGDGFDALFEDFAIKHLPDKRRTEWLKQN
ncbi:DUF1349 domain-containing protein [uncultured Aquimarina sp.]|uniref:DUF1349 domain-containing protein n=1 Tax=uncultured Aquimarina sp. TaxID=575652 RepID=UPI002604014B|nr:DUF1349 domain-containing protein [uncultured Aquimarina sp.]